MTTKISPALIAPNENSTNIASNSAESAENLIIIKELLSLDLVESTIKSLKFNIKKSSCASCNMMHYEDFSDYKSHKLVEGILSRLRQVRNMKTEKLNLLKLSVKTGDTE